MTFVLKDFEELKKNFQDAIIIILKREKKQSIDLLDEPRRSQMKFLHALSLTLTNDIQNNRPKAEAAEIFAGAMFLIMNDIKRSIKTFQNKDNSLLYTSLRESLAGAEPSTKQLAGFYTRLSSYFSLIFVDNDSSKGLKKQHSLESVASDRLIKLILACYDLERDTKIKLHQSLKVTGDRKGDSSDYSAKKPIPHIIIHSLNNLTTLQNQLKNLIHDELAKHNVPSIQALEVKNKERYKQLSFLTSVEKYINQISSPGFSEDEKVAILAGVMYLVRAQINKEYSNEALSNDTIPSSTIHSGLTDILKTSEASCEHVEQLIRSANRFIQAIAIDQSKPEEFAICKDSLFSKINKFDLIPFLVLAQEMICTCRSDALQRCIKNLKDAEAQKPSDEKNKAGGWSLSFALPFFSKTKKEVEQSNDDALEESSASGNDNNCQASATI